MGDDYPDGESDAVMLPVESSWIPVQGEVSGDDVDVFRLYVTAGASLSVTAYGYGTAAPAGAEPMLELRGQAVPCGRLRVRRYGCSGWSCRVDAARH